MNVLCFYGFFSCQRFPRHFTFKSEVLQLSVFEWLGLFQFRWDEGLQLLLAILWRLNAISETLYTVDCRIHNGLFGCLKTLELWSRSNKRKLSGINEKPSHILAKFETPSPFENVRLEILRSQVKQWEKMVKKRVETVVWRPRKISVCILILYFTEPDLKISIQYDVKPH